MLETGDAIDRYTVDRLLGEGGMADVYRVRHRTLGTPAALKVLRMNGRQVQERLVQEGQVQAGLRHPNIVEVRDVLEVAGFPALLLELVEGPSLEALLIEGRLPYDEAEEIFRGILLAVEHAHKQGLVHRDLKPGNVLLAPKLGGGWIPKVADFGLARVVQDDDASMRKTRSGIAMGTPRYMSPEQIRDAKNVDQRTDIFALGAILYELVCGEAAFERSDIAAIFNATLSGTYKSPASLAPGVPERTLRAIDASLKTRKEQRIPDCGTFRAVLDGKPFVPPIPDVPADAARHIPAAPRTIVSADTIDLSQPVARSSTQTNSPSMIGAAVVGGGVVAGGVVLAGLLLLGLAWWLLRPASVEPVANSTKPTPEITVQNAASGGPSAAETSTNPTPTKSTQATTAADSSRSGGAHSPPETSGSAAVSASSGGSAAPAEAPKPPETTSQPVESTVSATTAPGTQKEAPPASSPPVSPKPSVPKATASGVTPSDSISENVSVGARVSYSGDAVKVWLVGSGGRRVARGVVPEGRYEIEADFGDGEKTPAGEADLEVGDEVSLDCSKKFKRCKVKK